MRRREKIVIIAALLSLGLLAIQYLPLEWRYISLLVFVILTFLASGWALAKDLQPHEWITVVPFPALYAGSVGLFYFLLPTNVLSRVFILGMFGVGMYALLLTSNIYSVAKGRTIQLLYAAHAVGLFFTLLTSLLYTNTIFSLRIPFWGNALLVGAVHFPLIFMSLWSIRLEGFISSEILLQSGLLTLLAAEFALLLSFLPVPVWNSSLFVMIFLYIGLGILHSFLRGRLFKNTVREYSLVAALMGLLFLLMFPLK